MDLDKCAFCVVGQNWANYQDQYHLQLSSHQAYPNLDWLCLD